MRALVTIVALLMVLPVFGQENVPVRATLLEGSAIEIDGTSTVNSFTCKSDALDGWGRLAGYGDAVQTEVRLIVPVRSFDCGKRRMNQDMFQAMQGAQHPAIEFELVQVTNLGATATGQRLRVEGILRLAGVRRPISFVAEGHQTSAGRMHVRGELPLLMSDFGIDPPSALMGLVQAHDRIEIRFNLMAAIEGPGLM